MKNFIPFLLILFSLSSALASETCDLQGSTSLRSPASANPCDTATELMSIKVEQKQFVSICKEVIKSDPACKKLQPSKRLKCTTPAANNLLSVTSTGDAASRIFQCVKGFVWDSMYELGKFVVELIKTLVGSAVKNSAEITRFLLDPFYRTEVLSKSNLKGGKLALAFLRSSAMYFSREYPKNLVKNPLNPLMALGETLADPLVKFMTEAVQTMVAEYTPQWNCMNGPAKLNTICRTAGEFFMPPAFLFQYLKYGVKGLQLLSKSPKVGKFLKNFSALNEVEEASAAAIVAKSSFGKLKKAPAAAPKASVVARESVAKPITKHTDAELVAIARREAAAVKKTQALEAVTASEIKKPEHFEGKDSFLDYEKASDKKRADLDGLYPLETHFPVGVEGAHQTLIQEPSKLLEKKIIGVESTYVGTYESPLISAHVEVYEGTVKKITNKGNSAYPEYEALIVTPSGVERTVSLTHSRGLRVPKDSGVLANPFKGSEEAQEALRIKATREKFLKDHSVKALVPKAYVPSSKVVADGLASLSAPEAKKILEFRQRLLETLHDPKLEYLVREEKDKAIRPIFKLQDESHRAMVEEAQRLMNDTTSKNGFNNWFADMVTEILVEKAKKGELSWSTKESTLADVHFNYPWAEGAHGLPFKNIKLVNYPVIKDADLISVLDKRLERSGFHEGFKDITLDVPMAAGTKHLAVLKGDNLDETTPLFRAYTRGNIQFLDDYFIGKPHGVYSHILQNLYMSERFIEPGMNDFGKNMYEPFLKMQTSLVDDAVGATRYNDYVGLRSPANPDHVNNMLKLTVTDEVPLKYIKAGPPSPHTQGPVERLSRSVSFKQQSSVIEMAKTPKIAVKGSLDVEFKAATTEYIPTILFDPKIIKEASKTMKSLPPSIREAQGEFYVIMKPEIGKMTIVSPNLNEAQLATIRSALEKDQTTLHLMGGQAGSKINRHMKVTFGKNPKILMLRPDEDKFLYQNVHEQTFSPWAKSAQDNFPLSMVDKSAEPLLKSADEAKLVDWQMIEDLEPQVYRTFCGLASTCTLVKPKVPLTQEQILANNAIIKKPQEVVGIEGTNPGYELDNMSYLAANNGKTATIYKATDDLETGAEKLREALILSLKEEDVQMVANFDGITLGGKTGGHYSPLAAYDPKTDKVLVLDVALHRNESFWVPVKDLYRAMTKPDSFGRPRGFVSLHEAPSKLPRLGWETFDDVLKVKGLTTKDATFLKNFFSSSDKGLRTRLLKKFQTQAPEATSKDLEAIRDLSKINGKCE
jgi:Phytochelatin synthase